MASWGSVNRRGFVGEEIGGAAGEAGPARVGSGLTAGGGKQVVPPARMVLTVR